MSKASRKLHGMTPAERWNRTRAWRRRTTAVVCAAVLSTGPALPQDGAPRPSDRQPTSARKQAPAQAPALRVTTRVVQVSVIAQDKKGEPVSDLTREDFSITDHGQVEAVRFFAVESYGKVKKPSKLLPRNTFTNRWEEKTGVPTSVTVILFDTLNTQFSDQAYARKQVLKFLEQVQPQDRVALYLLGGQLTVLHDFTSDAAPLVRALAKYRGRYSAELDASTAEVMETELPELDELLNLSLQRLADFNAINRAQRTASALEAIAQHVASIPGRKNLVWISGSFPFDLNLDTPMTPQNASLERRTFRKEIERAARALNDANLAVYPVDARGLLGLAATNPAFSAATPSMRPRMGAPQASLSGTQSNLNTMRQIADLTGGRAFYNTNDIYGSVRKAVDDSRVAYVLGYYPSHGKWDGKFREIKVQVKRPGVRLRYRRGYFAVAEEPLNHSQKELYLREAAESVLDATALGLTVTAKWIDVPGAEKLKLEFRVERQDVQLEEKNDRWEGELDVLYVERNEKGQAVNGVVENLRLSLTKATYEAAKADGLQFTREMQVLRQGWQLRVVVRDAGSGAIGAVTIPVGKSLSAGE